MDVLVIAVLGFLLVVVLAGLGVLLRRRPAVLRWVGVAIGVLVGFVVALYGDLGIGLLLAAPLFGLCTLAGVLLGELAVPAPGGPIRTAGFEVRRIRDYLPVRLGRAVAVAGGVLVVLLVATTVAGSPDDLGRAGRSLARECGSDLAETHGPWPGSFYTGPLAVVLLAGLLIAYAATRAIVRRPRTGEVAVDDARRRRSARVATGAAGVFLAIPLAGVGLTAAGGLLGISCAPMWWTVVGRGLLVLVTAALVLALFGLVAVFAPVDRPAR